MKISAIAMVAAVAAVALSAHAATGMPSQDQTGSAHAANASALVETGADSELGSYGRYLRLNGKSRDEAIAEAANIDRSAVRNAISNHASTHASASKPASAQSVQ